ncbi:MOB kinase activator-like 2 [Eumeta japonica]|uniref:MOB kinase activator-like 2 n=1 Tax=Eumeta variegata TaxID=151549 RepID=A0A4C1T1W6_EUMVA|nr:MOB kinase activator-like 2 [Eumeta japonica]
MDRGGRPARCACLGTDTKRHGRGATDGRNSYVDKQTINCFVTWRLLFTRDMGVTFYMDDVNSVLILGGVRRLCGGIASAVSNWTRFKRVGDKVRERGTRAAGAVPAATRARAGPSRRPPVGRRGGSVGVMCHAVVLGVLFSLPSYLYSAVPFRLPIGKVTDAYRWAGPRCEVAARGGDATPSGSSFTCLYNKRRYDLNNTQNETLVTTVFDASACSELAALPVYGFNTYNNNEYNKLHEALSSLDCNITAGGDKKKNDIFESRAEPEEHSKSGVGSESRLKQETRPGLERKARRKDRDEAAGDPKLYLQETLLERKLPELDMRQLVELPPGLDYNEWLASHTLALFEHVNLLYGTVSEFCTAASCADMTGPDGRAYAWYDERGKKSRVAAPQYVDYVMTYTQKMINDESVFPTKYANEFPTTFESVVRRVARLLFHVVAHLYAAHFRELVLLRLHAHLHLTFAHLTALDARFGLIDAKETEVLRDLEVALRLSEPGVAAGAGEADASPRRRSPVVTQPLATA